RQICSSSAAGAHSTARSAWSGKASKSMIGHAMCSASSQPSAFVRSRAATPASARPGIPSASRSATSRPTVPSPAMATRVTVCCVILVSLARPVLGHDGIFRGTKVPTTEAILPQLAHVRTAVLEIAYEDSGPAQALPVILLHGYPYDVRA